MSHYDKKEKRTLTVYVSIFFLLVTGFAAAGYVSYRNFEGQFHSQAEYQISAIAEIKVNGLVNWRKERLSDANFLYQNPAFSALVERYLENPDNVEARARLLAWLGNYQVYDQYDWVQLLDMQGQTRLSSPDGIPPLSPIIAEHIPEVLQTEQPTLVDFYRRDSDGQIRICLLIPIMDVQTGNQTIGLVAISIDPQVYLYPYIQNWPINSTSAETLLVRRDGQDVLFLNELRFIQDAALTLRYPLTDTDTPAVKAALGQTGVVEGLDYRGEPVLADIRAVPDSPWFLVAKMDIAEAHAPLMARLWQTFGIIGMAIFVAGAGLALVWRQQRIFFYHTQVEAAEALRESEDKFKYIFDYSVVGKSITHFSGEMHVNKALCDMLGYSLQEMQEKKWQEITHPDDIELTQNAIGTLISGEKESARFVKRFVRKNGSIVWVDLSSVIRRDQQNQPLYLISVVIDITERKQAENALCESEEKYRRLFDNAPLGIFQSTLEGEVISTNSAFALMFGYDSPEDAMQSIKNVSTDVFADPNRRAEIIRLTTENPDLRTFENVYRRKDGSTFIGSLNTMPIGDPDGHLVRIEGIVEDISERKRMQEMLVKRAQQLAIVADVSAAISANLDQAQLLQSVADLSKERFDFYHAHVYLLNEAGDTLILAAGAGEVGRQMMLQGRQISIHREHSLVARTARERKGVIVNDIRQEPDFLPNSLLPDTRAEMAVPIIVGETLFGVLDVQANQVNRFIEEDVRIMTTLAAQIAVAVQNARLFADVNFQKYALDQHSIVAITDVTGKIVYVNDKFCQISKYFRAELIGQDHRILNSEYHPKVFMRDLWVTIANGKVWEGEIHDRAKDGTLYWVDTTIVPLLNEQGQPHKYVAISADITERKRAEAEILKLNAELEQRVSERTAQLEITNKELEAFSYSVSHDLRAPLRGIDGWSQALLEDYRDKLDKQGQQYIDRVRSETQHMGHLIDDLLQLSRLTRAEMVKEQVDLSVLAQTVAERLKQDEPLRPVDFNIQAGLTAEGDAHLLKIVLANLLGNAFKFTGKRADARIEFGETELEGQHVFFIRDNGAGFDMAYSQQLFGVFQRMHKITDFPGTGVGLATVQRIIHRHGGRVWAEAELERGATFYFTLG
ncbi:MAG: PAS domain S-box protein [Anaerolineales bacterium]|nr:PAS domain S-box protein [Anaerolineales bacterium]